MKATKTILKTLSLLLTLVMVFQTGAVGFAANTAEAKTLPLMSGI